MAFERITYEIEAGVALVTLTDPTTLNALSVAMAEEVAEAVSMASREARCLVVTGAGRGFSSGANLASGALPPGADGLADLGMSLEKTYNPLVSALRDLPIPIVTAVNGAAAGIGCSLALMGDIIIASESAYFLQAFRRIGLVPDGGATYHLPRMIGKARAMEMMLLGDKLPAAKALEWGLINRVVADGDLLAAAKVLALDLASGPTRALGMIRRLTWAALDNNWEDQLLAERRQQLIAGRTEDFIEGVQAFFQKRPAQFKGN
jgi:2-(1,2-epoxy-1,2-dihydrophenyl)acetyl-CoA isomerase